MNMLLSGARARMLIANRLVKQMGSLEYYEPATKAAPKLAMWLNEQKGISPLQLRRLTLAVLMHWYDFASYHGNNFTTVPSNDEDFKLPFPYSWTFSLYNSLSNGKPIKDSTEFEEQVGGFTPIQIDPVRNLIDFVTGHRCLRIELAVEQGYYETNEPVNISLTIRNLTNTTITLNNERGPTIKFVAEESKRIIREYVYRTPESTNRMSGKVVVPPNTPAMINWITDLPKKSHYLIRAQVYVPYHERVADLLVELYHGLEPMLTPVVTRSFCTL